MFVLTDDFKFKKENDLLSKRYAIHREGRKGLCKGHEVKYHYSLANLVYSLSLCGEKDLWSSI